MNSRKISIEETADYLQFEELFTKSGLEFNLDQAGVGPEGLITCWRAVTEEGRLAGGAAITKKKGVFVLNDLAVDKELRGSGIGMRLAETAMIRLHELGARKIVITSKAPRFFEKLGYYHLDDMPDIFGCRDCHQYGTTCEPEPMAFDISGERLLFIDSCVTTHHSRTRKLCDVFMWKFIKEHPGVLVDTVVVEKGLAEPLDREAIYRRNDLIEAEAWDDPMFDLARQFKAADHVLIGAPYWDCAFPAILKVYIENIVVTGLTFRETEKGYSGLCPCRDLTYITTAGGPIFGSNLGFDYIRGIGTMLGVQSFREYRAENLDIVGNDVEKIMAEAVAAIEAD
jgi:FMN-dependent NADH-azoreductase